MSDYDQPNMPLKIRDMENDRMILDIITESRERAMQLEIEAKRAQIHKRPRWKWWWEK